MPESGASPARRAVVVALVALVPLGLLLARDVARSRVALAEWERGEAQRLRDFSRRAARRGALESNLERAREAVERTVADQARRDPEAEVQDMRRAVDRHGVRTGLAPEGAVAPGGGWSSLRIERATLGLVGVPPDEAPAVIRDALRAAVPSPVRKVRVDREPGGGLIGIDFTLEWPRVEPSLMDDDLDAPRQRGKEPRRSRRSSRRPSADPARASTFPAALVLLLAGFDAETARSREAAIAEAEAEALAAESVAVRLGRHRELLELLAPQPVPAEPIAGPAAGCWARLLSGGSLDAVSWDAVALEATHAPSVAVSPPAECLGPEESTPRGRARRGVTRHPLARPPVPSP